MCRYATEDVNIRIHYFIEGASAVTVINTNVGALMARTYATKANDKMQTSMERLSSGLRINSAADDAAGLAVANKMSSQLSGIKMAIRNSQDGISLVQTAESWHG